MRIISTITEVDLSLSPQDIAYQLSGSDYLCFLDSSLSPDKYSRFSYIGWEPSFSIKSRGLKNEFINIGHEGNKYSWVNGYYDNAAKKVEGVGGGKVRMTLTGQVFSVMSGLADNKEIEQVVKSVNKFLSFNEYKILGGKGKISHGQAEQKAIAEYD